MTLRYLPISFDSKDLKEDGTFSGYASTYGNKDLGGDIVMPGAFTKTLSVRPPNKIKMLRDHDPGRIVGVWRSMREDSKGLAVEGMLVKSTRDGGEAYDLMKAGALDAMSIGYRTVDSEYDRKQDARLLKELDLHEVSLVGFPMNPAAGITAVKNDFDPRELEDGLREAGLSRADAVKAVAIFRKRLRDAGDHTADQREADEASSAAQAAMLRKWAEAFRA
jgi:hypothetical protein